MAPHQGYPREYYRGGNSLAKPLSQQPGNEFLASSIQHEAFDAVATFFSSRPPHFQYHLEEMDEVVHQERTMTIDSEVEYSTIQWILMLG